jgi:hypothetical protein
MISNSNLNASNFNLYAAQNYTNPRVLDVDEFYEDLYRFKYLKKLFTKYENGNGLHERLILNHLILIYNVFGMEAATNMCFFKINEKSWPALKTFILFLSYIKEEDFINIPSDLYVAKKLQNL